MASRATHGLSDLQLDHLDNPAQRQDQLDNPAELVHDILYWGFTVSGDKALVTRIDADFFCHLRRSGSRCCRPAAGCCVECSECCSLTITMQRSSSCRGTWCRRCTRRHLQHLLRSWSRTSTYGLHSTSTSRVMAGASSSGASR